MILHITDRNSWERARVESVYRTPSLDTEGFIHCSTVDQLVDTANRFFRGAADLVVLCIDEERVGVPVRFEAPAVPEGTTQPEAGVPAETTELFPHVYGPIRVDAIVGVVDLQSEADGSFVLPRALSRTGRTTQRLR